MKINLSLSNMELCYIPKRFIFAALSFFGMFIIYAVRLNMSVAIVAMVNSTKEIIDNQAATAPACPSLWRNESLTIEKQFKGEKYNWDPKTQGILLSSFFYGYILTQLPGGVLCSKYGAKWLFGGGILVTSALYLLIPLAASWGVVAMCIIRILEGIGQGLTIPALAQAISNWSPTFERSRLSTIINLGIPIGIIGGSSISGFMCSSNLIGGWPSTFYLFGTLGCAWFILWSFLMYETPEKNPYISKDELLHIQQNRSDKPQSSNSIPWRDIFSSSPMWAVIIAHFGHSFALFFFLIMTPTYFKTILHFDIKTNGLLSALPYAVNGLSALLSSQWADKWRKSKKMSITNIRKICNTIGTFIPGLCCLGIIAAGCQSYIIIALLCIGMFFNGFLYSGFFVTFIDMSPDFAGILMGISNTIATIGAIISLMMAGLITATGQTVKNWNTIFSITCAVFFANGLFFAIFASAEVQPWGVANKDVQKDEKKKDKIFIIETKM